MTKIKTVNQTKSLPIAKESKVINQSVDKRIIDKPDGPVISQKIPTQGLMEKLKHFIDEDIVKQRDIAALVRQNRPLTNSPIMRSQHYTPPSLDLSDKDVRTVKVYTDELIKNFPVLLKPEGLVNEWSIKLWVDNSPVTRSLTKSLKKEILDFFQDRLIVKETPNINSK